MGKHFDALVDLIKEPIPQSADSLTKVNVRAHLTEVVNKFALFDFPLREEEIFPNSGMEMPKYNAYIHDYIKMSQEHGRFLATPFSHTAIEDPVSVVFLDSLGGSKYRVTSVGAAEQNLLGIGPNIWIGNIEIFLPENKENNLIYRCSPIYASTKEPLGYTEIRVDKLDPLTYRDLSKDLASATTAFLQQNVYIMDPENFIIRMDSHASLKEDRKQSFHPTRERKPRKTNMRPHYICLSHEDAVDHIKNEAVEPRPLHVVRGHWKVLSSEKYKAARGKVLQIEQYNRGKGIFEGKNGIRYSVYIKESIDRILAPKE